MVSRSAGRWRRRSLSFGSSAWPATAQPLCRCGSEQTAAAAAMAMCGDLRIDSRTLPLTGDQNPEGLELEGLREEALTWSLSVLTRCEQIACRPQPLAVRASWQSSSYYNQSQKLPPVELQFACPAGHVSNRVQPGPSTCQHRGPTGFNRCSRTARGQQALETQIEQTGKSHVGGCVLVPRGASGAGDAPPRCWAALRREDAVSCWESPPRVRVRRSGGGLQRGRRGCRRRCRRRRGPQRRRRLRRRALRDLLGGRQLGGGVVGGVRAALLRRSLAGLGQPLRRLLLRRLQLTGCAHAQRRSSACMPQLPGFTGLLT